MINQLFAQNFIDNINRQMSIRINVMNEKGVIIASTDKSRVGDFHILAYEIITQKKRIAITEKPEKDLIGVISPGVNMLLTDKQETLGVIGVSGDPAEVLEIARMTKIAFEAMYEYEKQRRLRINVQNDLEHFSYLLFHEAPLSRQSIQKAAKKLGLKDPWPRIPLYLIPEAEADWSSVSDAYQQSHLFQPNDLVLPLDNGVLLLKSFESYYSPSLRDYTEELAGEISSILLNSGIPSAIPAGSRGIHFYVMPVLDEFQDYRIMYRYLKMLTELTRRDASGICYFEDHLLHCLCQDSRKSLGVLLGYSARQIAEGMPQEHFLETMQGLIERDMNGEASAELLHLHRNSLFARLRRIREIIPANPLSSTRDAIFLMALYEIMMSEKKD